MKNYYIPCMLLFLCMTEKGYALNVGRIDALNYSTYICRDTSCTERRGITFLPSGGSLPLTISNNLVTGYAWGDDLGWINFSPSGSGVTYATATGNLSGYAWSSASGFINFRPSNSGALSFGIPVGVTIQTDGSWLGYAFASGKNGGWIKFDCSQHATCVKTVWTDSQAGISSGGGYFQMPQVVAQLPQVESVQNVKLPIDVDNKIPLIEKNSRQSTFAQESKSKLSKKQQAEALVPSASAPVIQLLQTSDISTVAKSAGPALIYSSTSAQVVTPVATPKTTRLVKIRSFLGLESKNKVKQSVTVSEKKETSYIGTFFTKVSSFFWF